METFKCRKEENASFSRSIDINMDSQNNNQPHEIEPIIEYEDCTDYVPSQEQVMYEREIQMRMRERRKAAERRRVNRNRTIALILLLAIIFIIVKSCSGGSGNKDESSSAADSSSVSSASSDSSKVAEANINKTDSSKSSDSSTSGNVSTTGKKIEQINGMTFVDDVLIVNKTYSLPSDYDPGTSAAAQNAFDEMAAAAMNDGIYLFVNSGYRSYQEQETLYNNYAWQRGTDEADKVSSRPGHSEHQTGLTFDVNSTEFSFGDTQEAKWLAAHCAEYGFIIRYPQGKEDITGYSYEPWHIRYLGVEKAKEVADSGLCLEEYLGVTSDYKYAEDMNENTSTASSADALRCPRCSECVSLPTGPSDSAPAARPSPPGEAARAPRRASRRSGGPPRARTPRRACGSQRPRRAIRTSWQERRVRACSNGSPLAPASARR